MFNFYVYDRINGVCDEGDRDYGFDDMTRDCVAPNQTMEQYVQELQELDRDTKCYGEAMKQPNGDIWFVDHEDHNVIEVVACQERNVDELHREVMNWEQMQRMNQMVL